MLRPEIAQQRLKEYEVKFPGKRRAERIAQLPERLRPSANALCGRGPAGEPIKEGDRQGEDARKAAIIAFEALEETEQIVIFDSLFPQMGAQVLSGWRLFARLPYQRGYHRPAFRAPHAADLHREARLHWIDRLLDYTAGYEQDVNWFAAWTPYLNYAYGADVLGILFAGAIDAGGPTGDAVYATLVASAQGEHEIGAMGHHVTRGLLTASRPEGWQFIERLLLAAQRHEGLRQVVLETIPEAHPLAFARMLRLIVEHDLTRFSATVRAICLWFDYEPEAMPARRWPELLRAVLRCLEDPEARAAALAGDDLTQQHLALWTLAYENAPAALPSISRLAADPRADRRLMATRFLHRLQLPQAREALLERLDDPNLEVAQAACDSLHYGAAAACAATDLFERLERLIARVPRERQAEVAGLLQQSLGNRPVVRLLPYLSRMHSWDRTMMAKQLAASVAGDEQARDAVFKLLGDLNEEVRKEAFKAFSKCRLTEAEVNGLEGLLTRKPADLRQGALQLLLAQDDATALAGAERLLAAKDAGQRLAGLELARELVRAARATEPCRRMVARYQQARPRRTEAEEEVLCELLDDRRAVPTLDDGLGLCRADQRTHGPTPTVISGLELATAAGAALIQSLDELVFQQRETPIRILADEGGKGTKALLGNVQWDFPGPDPARARDEDLSRLPLREVWEAWWRDRPAALRDADGFELLRAIVAARDNRKLRYGPVVNAVLAWLLRLYPPDGATDFLLDAVETQFALTPKDLLERAAKREGNYDGGWRGKPHRISWLTLAREHRDYHAEQWNPEQQTRLWRLVRWMDEPGTQLPRWRPQLQELLHAYRVGAATQADLIDHLIGPRPMFRDGIYRHAPQFEDLRSHSGRKPSPLCRQFPILRETVDLCRKRIIDVELARADMPTAASPLAVALTWSGGAETLLNLLARYGRERFVDDSYYYGEGNLSKRQVYSDLIRKAAPAEGDTPESFAALVQEAQIAPERLIELAMFAPQWARHVERALGWPLLAEGVWWLRAHSTDTGWGSQFRVDEDVRDSWMTGAIACASLPVGGLAGGAVDVIWFRRAYSALGPERWAQLENAAHYGSHRGGHRRALLFAAALRGGIARAEILQRIGEKRDQNAVRALGLLPLPEGPERDTEVLARYRTLQEFLRASRDYGSMRQASEKAAVQVGLDNLAATAGYPDPVRLEWAMEAAEVADLAQGPLSEAAEGVTVTLSVNGWGKPELTVTRNGKLLKETPRAARQEPAVAALLERKQDIERQSSRMRRSLEQAMCRGEVFRGAELKRMLAHPVLAPMLRSLVFCGEDFAGYPLPGGRAAALGSHDDNVQPLADDAPVRIAHPYDLLQTEAWPQWQRDCFLRERIQPFKQVFRELYVLTPAETDDGLLSRRYEGHQVNPRQAMALLGGRGWIQDEDELRRTFAEQGLLACLSLFMGYTTPAEVEGLTLEHVGFYRRDTGQRLPLAEVPPLLFSEAMRDLDLAVSVAHVGGVDPEASASTVEMRAAILRETLPLLKIANVRFGGDHALIDGSLATYSVHLGSAVVHRQPGGHLCIVPVQGQHHGRLFLPFADDDPKTAEVVSKVLLLAKDQEIKDPIILKQILSGGR